MEEFDARHQSKTDTTYESVAAESYKPETKRQYPDLSRGATVRGLPSLELSLPEAENGLAQEKTAELKTDAETITYKYDGPRDGSAQAILGIAKEYQYKEIYRDSPYYSLAEQGGLGCAISVSRVMNDAGVVERNGKPLTEQFRARQLLNAVVSSGWKVLEPGEEIKPGYFANAFAAVSGSGANHSIIIGEPAKGGEKHPVTGAEYAPGTIMAWNNTDRTRPNIPDSQKFKYWDIEPFGDATSLYRGYVVLRPPEKDEKYDPKAEMLKIKKLVDAVAAN